MTWSSQDFPISTLALLVSVVRDANRVFLGGDSAQTVASVNFKTDCFRQFLHDLRGPGDHDVVVSAETGAFVAAERIDHLLVNYRSHDGVVRASNLCLDLLEKKKFFRHHHHHQ